MIYSTWISVFSMRISWNSIFRRAVANITVILQMQCHATLSEVFQLLWYHSITCLQYNFLCGYDTLTHVFQYFTVYSQIADLNLTLCKEKSPIQIMSMHSEGWSVGGTDDLILAIYGCFHWDLILELTTVQFSDPHFTSGPSLMNYVHS